MSDYIKINTSNNNIIAWNNLTKNDLLLLNISELDLESITNLMQELAFWSYTGVQPASLAGINNKKHLDIVKLQLLRNIKILYPEYYKNGRNHPSNLYRMLKSTPTDGDDKKIKIRKQLSCDKYPLNPWKNIPQNHGHIVEKYLDNYKWFLESDSPIFFMNPFIPYNWDDAQLEYSIYVYFDMFNHYNIQKINHLSEKLGFKSIHPIKYLFNNISFVLQKMEFKYLPQFLPCTTCREFIDKIKLLIGENSHYNKFSEQNPIINVNSSDSESTSNIQERHQIQQADSKNSEIYNNDKNSILYFDEYDYTENSFFEGKTIHIFVNKYERDKRARDKCLDFYGYKCAICGFDFKKVYGKIGENFIHVHHKIPLEQSKEIYGNQEYKVDPKNDLIPICPNCHAMIHKLDLIGDAAVDELKKIVKERS